MRGRQVQASWNRKTTTWWTLWTPIRVRQCVECEKWWRLHYVERWDGWRGHMVSVDLSTCNCTSGQCGRSRHRAAVHMWGQRGQRQWQGEAVEDPTSRDEGVLQSLTQKSRESRSTRIKTCSSQESETRELPWERIQGSRTIQSNTDTGVRQKRKRHEHTSRVDSPIVNTIDARIYSYHDCLMFLWTQNTARFVTRRKKLWKK